MVICKISHYKLRWTQRIFFFFFACFCLDVSSCKQVVKCLISREQNQLHYFLLQVKSKIPLSHIMRKPVLPYANNKGADQPAHLRNLISAFVIRCLDSIISLVSILAISWLSLASLAAQAGLCLTWSETPKTGFLVTRLICLTPITVEYCLLRSIYRSSIRSLG